MNRRLCLVVPEPGVRMRIDAFTHEWSRDPLRDIWTLTVAHEAQAQVSALPEAIRPYRVIDADNNDTIILASRALIGWDAMARGEYLHLTIFHPNVDTEAEPSGRPT